MINYLIKDITSVETGIVVHGCNAQGTMGAGVARAIRDKWPVAYKEYLELCRKAPKPQVLLGVSQIICVSEEPKLFVANCFTQLYYGRQGKYADTGAIASSLGQVYDFASSRQLTIYMPKIGCGLGGLDWDKDVKDIVESLALRYDPIEINILDIK